MIKEITMKAYIGFDKDMKCRNFQEVWDGR